jgi:hypothetical protein
MNRGTSVPVSTCQIEQNRTVLPLGVGLIRFGGRVDYGDLVSSSFVEESLQVLGGVRISIWRSLVAAGERPVAI